MPRRRYNNPTPLTTIHTSIEAINFIENRKYKRTEPNYSALDRILSEYQNQKQIIEELEFNNIQLRESLQQSRELRVKLERQLESLRPLSNIIK